MTKDNSKETRARRSQEAAERQAEYDKLTPGQKLINIETKRPGKSTREAARIKKSVQA